MNLRNSPICSTNLNVGRFNEAPLEVVLTGYWEAQIPYILASSTPCWKHHLTRCISNLSEIITPRTVQVHTFNSIHKISHVFLSCKLPLSLVLQGYLFISGGEGAVVLGLLLVVVVTVIMEWNFKKFCKHCHVSFWGNIFALSFLDSLLHGCPGSMGSCGQPPARTGEGVQTLQPYNEVPFCRKQRNFCYLRAAIPGLQLQTAAYSVWWMSAQQCHYPG